MWLKLKTVFHGWSYDLKSWAARRKLCANKCCGTCAAFMASQSYVDDMGRCMVMTEDESDESDAYVQSHLNGWRTIDITRQRRTVAADAGCKWWAAVTKQEYTTRRKLWAYYAARKATCLTDKEIHGS